MTSWSSSYWSHWNGRPRRRPAGSVPISPGCTRRARPPLVLRGRDVLRRFPLDNSSAGTDWGSWYGERRLVPYLRQAHDDGKLSRAAISLVETVIGRIGELAGPPEPPSRIHGDLWSGNVLWSGGRGCLIDPAAHGGHRETDLAMLALFGAPHLTEILRGYTKTIPLGGRVAIPASPPTSSTRSWSTSASLASPTSPG